MLELQPVSYDIISELRRVLPVWITNDVIGSENIRGSGRPPLSMQSVLEHIPAPDADIKAAMSELFVVELAGQLYIPDAKTLLEAWRSAVPNFNLRGTALHETLHAEDFLDVDGDDEVLAMTKRAIYDAPTPVLPSDEGRRLVGTRFTEDGGAKTAAWVGCLLLETLNDSSSVVEFTTSWRNLLPESWGPSVELGNLPATTYETQGEGTEMTIRWTGRRFADQDLKGTSVSATVDPTNDPQPSAKRNWHEKFRDSRNMKK